MKKQDQDRYKQSDSFYFKKHERYIGRKGKIYNRFKSPITNSVGNFKMLHAPVIISIYDVGKISNDDFIETLEFKDQLIKNIGKKDCILDFSHTEHITVAAMLVIFSEIQTLINVSL